MDLGVTLEPIKVIRTAFLLAWPGDRFRMLAVVHHVCSSFTQVWVNSV